jgi:hypothetical protein
MRRTRWGAAIVIGLSAVASFGAGPTAAAQRERVIKLIGAPALIDSNVGAGNGKHHFNAVVQVKSSIPDMQNLTVEFDVMQGGKLLRSKTETAGIRSGGGVVSADVVLPPKGTYSVKARFVSFEHAFADDVLAAAKIAGKPGFIRDQPPLCSMSTRVQNPAKGELSGLTDIYLIGLRQGKIVAAGSASLFDALKPGATVAVHVDYISCVKVDEVRAYVEGNGL